MSDVLQVAPDLSLPVDVATETLAILAVKRAGKSNAAVVLAEEMYLAGVQWVAIDPKGDWWGVRGEGTGPGLSVLVLGGLHADLPLEPTSGEVVADLVVQQGVTCVLDVSEMTRADQRRFLTAFAQRLYRTNRHPLHVFCEEADEYIPQMVRGESAKTVAAFEQLVKRGGFRGIGVTLVTQRSASLNNDVLTQVGTLFAMRTPSKPDRDKIRGWVEFHDAGADVLADLPRLHAGEAWVVSPEWLGDVRKVRFRRRSTFDSGATPKVGQAWRTPATLADVDLGAVKEAMAATVERVKSEDPKHLARRVSALEDENLSLRRAVEAARAERERVEVLVADTVWAARMEGLVDDLRRAADQAVVEFRAEVEEMAERYPSAPDDGPTQPAVATPGVPARRRAHPATAEAVHPSGDRALTGPQRRVLTALAQHGPRDGERLAVLTGYSMGGGFKNILGGLRSEALVTPARVTPIAITEDGLSALGPYERLPVGPALLDWWVENRLSSPESTVVAALRDAGPMDVDSLAGATGYRVGGGFKNILGHLRTLGVITPARVTPIDLHDEMR